jgi:hypothetical protein
MPSPPPTPSPMPSPTPPPATRWPPPSTSRCARRPRLPVAHLTVVCGLLIADLRLPPQNASGWAGLGQHQYQHHRQQHCPSLAPPSPLPILPTPGALSSLPQVCSSACTAGDATCQPLKSFRLRLDDGVLAAPADFIKMANPAGEVEAACAPAGPGWFISGPELLSLATSNPAEVRAGLAACLLAACLPACLPTTCTPSRTLGCAACCCYCNSAILQFCPAHVLTSSQPPRDPPPLSCRCRRPRCARCSP